jgi:hypothetical protein
MRGIVHQDQQCVLARGDEQPREWPRPQRCEALCGEGDGDDAGPVDCDRGEGAQRLQCGESADGRGERDATERRDVQRFGVGAEFG